jgi:hypothetical protein
VFRPILESSGSLSLSSLALLGGEVSDARVVSQRDCSMMKSLTEGPEPTCKMPSDLVVVLVGGVYRGKGSFLGHHYMMEDLSSSYLPMEYYTK